ncbi:MAG: site-specific integrase [Tannerellaceae bacterium]|nr:site-specific integrase [Tannerellaceae bacterium]
MSTINTYQKITKSASRCGKAPIYVSLYVSRQKVELPTGISIPIKYWDETKRRIRSGEKGAADKNLIIERIQARVNDVLVRARLKNKKLTKDSFIRAFNRPDDYDTFFDFIDFYQKRLSARIEASTMNIHKTVIKKLKEYNPELHFDDITHEWLEDYYIYLRKKLKNNENTAYKNMSTIRKYVRAAVRLGYMEENPFESWAIKRTTASYIYLTEEELERLVGLYNEKSLEDKYQDTLEFFLFLCFSSLHVGDAKQLRIEQISSTHLTYYRIKNRNKKPLPIIIPLSEPLKKNS